MDVNNTRFHLLLGRRDWTAHVPEPEDDPEADVVWDAEQGAVSLRPELYRFPTPRDAVRLDRDRRRGAGRDRYGNWYAVEGDGRSILFFPGGLERAEPFWPPPEAAPEPAAEAGTFRPVPPGEAPASLRFRGLAVTGHHYLVVGVEGPGAGLLAFDLHGGGPPQHLRWPDEIPFHPVELAPRPGGGVWILDRPPRGEGIPRYWALDRYFRVESRRQPDLLLEPGRIGDFRPVGGTAPLREAVTFPAGLSLVLGMPLERHLPFAIEGLPDDSVLIAAEDREDGTAWVYRQAFGVALGAPVSLNALVQAELARHGRAAEVEEASRWQVYDVAFVPAERQERGRVAGILYAVGVDGNQAFAFSLEADVERLRLRLLNRFLPLRRFGGRGLVAAGGGVYYDLGARWLPLTAQPRPRFREEGRFETRPDLVFDGKEPGCTWHRLFLDGCIPPGTDVIVESRAAEHPALLARVAWEVEPRPYRRGGGTEVPYYRPFSAEDGREGAGTWELLFQRARGRYLQLRLTLRGTGRSSPRLYALRLYYPRFSYLRAYLPAVYREDETSASFLDRFLANVEGTYTELEGRIADVQTLFDLRATPAEYLEWIASWFGVLLDPAYDAGKRRLFLKHAVALFRQRGTPQGLLRMIRLAIDPCPDERLFSETEACCGGGAGQGASTMEAYGVRLIERFLTRSAPGVLYGDPTVLDEPRLTVAAEETWTPQQGAEPLHARFRAFLQERYGTEAAVQAVWGAPLAALRLPPLPPVDPRRLGDWRLFLQRRIGFTYAEVAAGDAARYRSFLARRYRQVATLNQAYGDRYASFGTVALPTLFPESGRRLYDWIQFVSLALPLQRSAHRFTVLIPTEPGSDLNAQAERLALVARVVAQEKPAHTDFEVKPYWALFRVGTARLGQDTLLDEGSRYVALLLGRSYLAEGYLASAHPWNVASRIVTGRDAPGPAMVL